MEEKKGEEMMMLLFRWRIKENVRFVFKLNKGTVLEWKRRWVRVNSSPFSIQLCFEKVNLGLNFVKRVYKNYVIYNMFLKFEKTHTMIVSILFL